MNAIKCEIDLCNPAGNNLAQGDRRCILQVGAANHDDVGVFLRLLVQGVAQLLNTRVHGLKLLDHGNVHCGGEGVIRGLATVNVIVRVNGSLRSHDATRKFDGAVRDHFVGIHIGLSARTGLEDDQREMVVELALNDLIGGACNQVCNILGQLSQLGVCQCRSLLQRSQCAHHGAAPDESITADVEIVQ